MSRDRLILAISVALQGKICVSGWLGYGNALFLGFGSDVLPARSEDGRRSKPPYELQTSLAIWEIKSSTNADTESERAIASAAVQELIGLPVVAFTILNNLELLIEFRGSSSLRLRHTRGGDSTEIDLDLWWICVPGSRFIGVGYDGEIVVGSTLSPENDRSPSAN